MLKRQVQHACTSWGYRDGFHQPALQFLHHFFNAWKFYSYYTGLTNTSHLSHNKNHDTPNCTHDHPVTIPYVYKAAAQ